jgi:hypothetical protein
MSKISPRRWIKNALQQSIPTQYDPIIVASMGRSGSTLVYEALCKGLARARFDALQGFGLKIVGDVDWNLSGPMTPGVVYKTHALSHELPRGCKARVVFVFSSASDAALSVFACYDRYGADWIAEHFDHMRADGGFEQLGERDVLCMERQIDGWFALDHANVLCLRYERLWENAEALSDFVGFPVVLPERKPRFSRQCVDEVTAKKFSATYRQLDEKIAALPDCRRA